MNTSLSAHPYADFLHQVEKPARYLGGEHQSIVKDWGTVAVRAVLCFPDLYDIGMSHLGTKILYAIVNRQPDLCLERCFCPWPDMERELRQRNLPLVSLENHRPLSAFDVVGFSLQYELTFTNILTMLDLGGIPLHSDERTLEHPLVIAGGPVATHPEPLAPFIDVFVVGDGEERLPRLLRHYAALRGQGATRTDVLIALAGEGGVYCPALYERSVCDRSELVYVSAPKYDGVPARVQRALVEDITRYPFPDDSPIPVAEAIFDRMSIEIARGCTEGCRFCQAGMIYRPVRERDPQSVVDTLVSAIEKGGYDEGALTSLSTADYSCISPLVRRVMEHLRPRRVSLGISSLRAYGLDEDLLDEIASVKATGLTFAPEAGTQRMRDVICKNISEEDIYTTCHRVFSRGWDRVKLYFMIGLPTEEDEDVVGIGRMGRQALEIGRTYRRGVQVTVSVSSHVPKPHTPFQWAAMESLDSLRRKQDLLRECARKWRFSLRLHELQTSHLECIIGRGDIRTGWLIERAWRNGARFDGWNDQLRWEVWQAALIAYEIEFGLSRDIHLRTIPLDARLPWGHIDVGLTEGFLQREYHKALKNRTSPPCGKPYQAKVHHTNLEDARADQRKLICYHCGVTCDLTKMREERISFLEQLGAEHRPTPLPETERQKAYKRTQRGLAPHDFGQHDRIRYRLKYARLEPLSLQGHLDVVRVVQRTLRRAGLPLYYTQGYSPRPVLAFTPAMALGTRSLAEYADLTLTRELPVQALLQRLLDACEPGLVFLGVRSLEAGALSLSKAVCACDYAIVLGSADPATIIRRSAEAMASSTLPITVVRKGEQRSLDLRPQLLDVRLLSSLDSYRVAAAAGLDPSLPMIHLRVRETHGLSVRPVEIMQALFALPVRTIDIVRTACWNIGENGMLCDPLSTPGQRCEQPDVAVPA